MKKSIYIVDVSSMFFRAFYAIRPLTSTKGVPVNAVYGFMSMIVKLFKEKKPDHIVFCYDRKEPSFRKNLYTEYKAHRIEMPEDLQIQMPYLKQVASLLGICDLELENYEADDLIGTIATQAANQSYEVFIVSGDKDFCQLVNDRIFLYDTMKEIVYTPNEVKEKHGVTPDQFIDFLAITGDTSDNIPGVAGIGPKGAQKLIEQFGTLEKIYENIDSVSSASIKEKLLKSKDQAFLSKKLVTIVRDAPIQQTLEDFELKPFKTEELRSFLQELNFKTFEKNLLGDGRSAFHEPRKSSDPSREIVSSVTGAVFHTENQSVSADSEFESLQIQMKTWDHDSLQKRIDQNEKFFCFVHGSKIGVGFEYELYVSDLSATKLVFNNRLWNGFDLKTVWTQLGHQPSAQDRVEQDLMLMCYVLRAADSSEVDKLARHFLSREVDLDEIESDDEKMKLFYELCLLMICKVEKELEEKDLVSIYEKLERPMIPILYQMEKNGIKLDLEFLKKFSQELEEEIKKQEIKIHELASEKFNIGSPKQMGVILFEKLGLDVIKKTKTGYSTDNDVLEQLPHPIAKEIIEWRELSKLKSTYVDALPQLADQNARVHSHFNQALTTTGRLSSTNPNLQNIPIRTERGQRVRRAFIAEKGKKLLSVDYSQIELRVLAHISNDPGLIHAFRENLDIHAATAAEVFNVSISDVTKEQRRIAKAVNFGIAYGQGAFGLAETLGISRKESSDIIEKYFTKFAGIRDYIEKTKILAREQKYVETLFGRRRYIPELDNRNVMIQKFGERAAINAPIQGTASDLVKLSMIDLSKNLKLDLLLQVHDELVFEGTPNLIEEQLAWIVETMENVTKLKVPLKVNYAVGDNWDQAH
jgi:DNA polymerase-1